MKKLVIMALVLLVAGSLAFSGCAKGKAAAPAAEMGVELSTGVAPADDVAAPVTTK